MALLRMKRSAVIVLAAVAVCVLAVILAVLLVPSQSWAAGLEWFLNPPQVSPCGCALDPSNS